MQRKFQSREEVACQWESEVNLANWRSGVCKVLRSSQEEESFSCKRAVEMEGRQAGALASAAVFVYLLTTAG